MKANMQMMYTMEKEYFHIITEILPMENGKIVYLFMAK